MRDRETQPSNHDTLTDTGSTLAQRCKQCANIDPTLGECVVLSVKKWIYGTRHEAAKPGNYINPFKPDFTIVIFINYKPRIAVAIPAL